MTELRWNELRGEQVVYAVDRQERTYLPAAAHCPLCPTKPGGAPTEIPRDRFEIAVFENRFPALSPPGGTAEVVVYTDEHAGSLGTLSRERARALMWVWRQRCEELGSREDVEYVYVFENRGVEVGVTLGHPHGQIYAYPFVPPVAQGELAADERLGGCAVCELTRRELADAEESWSPGRQRGTGGPQAARGQRVVYANEAVLAYVPRAARWAYETHVVMRAHRPSLAACEPDELDGLADGLQAVVRGYDGMWDREMPYVMAVHQAPARSERGHVHVEFYPPLRTASKLKYLAGSEQGAGTFVADTWPEESARTLRAAIVDAT